jgi:tRNA A37 threonylcarbamoyladenosine synthetase subunit TsaC/SUA5/YrdC
MMKEGDLQAEIIDKVVTFLKNRSVIVLPIDNIFCIAGISPTAVKKISEKLSGLKVPEICLISSFKMLTDLAEYSKSDYDFMNRIWPGEIKVILKRNGTRSLKKITIRFPISKFILNILNQLEVPLYYSDVPVYYRKRDIVSAYKNHVDLIVIINELCKKHTLPLVVDISEHSLKIINAGKVSTEEIKSLYFLGKADE